MSAFFDNALSNTGQSVENDGSSATLDIVERCLHQRCSDRTRDGPPVHSTESVRHLGRKGDEVGERCHVTMFKSR